MRYKYVIGDCKDPYYNLAYEESLFQFADEETTIIFLWQNENTIVIGRNQDAHTECKVDLFLQDKGRIARRKSGGGAVYHDLGNLCFSIISHKKNVQICDYKLLVLKILSLFRVQASFNGRNDLIINGKKFSGNAAYNNGNVTCQHGTILIDTDMKRMNYYLTPDTQKMERNGVKSVSSRVINLSECSKKISIESFCSAFVKVYDMVPLKDAIDEKIVGAKRNMYASKEWIFEGRMK